MINTITINSFGSQTVYDGHTIEFYYNRHNEGIILDSKHYEWFVGLPEAYTCIANELIAAFHNYRENVLLYIMKHSTMPF